MRYAVVIEKTGTGYSVYVPDLPGCVAAARTLPLAQRRIRGAVAFHLEGLREDGVRVPRPRARAAYVSAPAPRRRAG